jgi:hypothetical protein
MFFLKWFNLKKIMVFRLLLFNIICLFAPKYTYIPVKLFLFIILFILYISLYPAFYCPNCTLLLVTMFYQLAEYFCLMLLWKWLKTNWQIVGLMLTITSDQGVVATWEIIDVPSVQKVSVKDLSKWPRVVRTLWMIILF